MIPFRIRRARWAMWVVASAFLVGTVFAAPAVAQSALPLLSVTPDGFVLSPGDILGVLIWREPSLGGQFYIDENGDVTLPMLGRVRAAGIPWRDLRDSLMVAYSRQLRTTSINLQPLRRVYVFGEVSHPGTVLLEPTLSFAGAVAMAGGAGPDGDLRHIRVVRDGKTLRTDVPVESLFVGAALKSQDQIYVGKKPWFDRNSAFVAGAALSLASIIVTVIRR